MVELISAPQSLLVFCPQKLEKNCVYIYTYININDLSFVSISAHSGLSQCGLDYNTVFMFLGSSEKCSCPNTEHGSQNRNEGTTCFWSHGAVNIL